MPQLPEGRRATLRSAPSQQESPPEPTSHPHHRRTAVHRVLARPQIHRPPTPPLIDSLTNTKAVPASPPSSSSASESSCPSPSPSPEPRRPIFQITQPLGRPTDLPTFLENIEQLKKLIIKAKNTLRRDKIAVLERELVGGEHGWRVGLAVAYLDGFLKGGGGIG